MFNAYPQQRTSCWKFIIPLCIAGGLCLVLYASFEASEDERPLSSDDPSLKRMQPFLSSQSFEIGLWTRQKPTGDEPSSAPETSRSSEEVERLRQQLLLERSRIAEQSAEIARLRGATPQQPSQDSQPTPPPIEEHDGAIPDSLFREPPLLSKDPAEVDKLWDVDTSPAPAPGGSMALMAVEKDNTITVKAGRDIVLQISKETTLEPVSHRPGADVIEGTVAESLNFTQQVPKNVTENSDPGRESEKSATQITVLSGQQSIVIQVRDGSEEAKLASRAPESEKGQELAQNITSATPMAMPELETVKAVPELPEPSALPAQDTGGNLDSPALRGSQSTPDRSLPVPVEEDVTTTKGYSAYANLALRTR